MRAHPPQRMTVNEFLVWAMAQPEGRRFELVNGEVVAMAPERVVHAETKAAAWLALRGAIRAAQVTCQALPDGMTVRIDEATVFEPDALVRCGPRLPDDAVEVPDPLIVVEVVSPSSAGTDRGAKLEGYFRLASVRHYLIVLTEPKRVIHHERTNDGSLRTRILGDGTLDLDPPGLSVDVASLFEA